MICCYTEVGYFNWIYTCHVVTGTHRCFEKRKLHLEVTDEKLQKRRAAWIAPGRMATRGYVRYSIDHVQQAHLGAELDMLQGGSGSEVTRDLH